MIDQAHHQVDLQEYKVSLSTHQIWHQSRRNIALGNPLARPTFTRFWKSISFWDSRPYVAFMQNFGPERTTLIISTFTFTFKFSFAEMQNFCPERPTWIPSTFNGYLVCILHRWVKDVKSSSINLRLCQFNTVKCRSPYTWASPGCWTSKGGGAAKIFLGLFHLFPPGIISNRIDWETEGGKIFK